MVFLRSVVDFALLPAALAPWFAAALPGVEVACALALLWGVLAGHRSARAAAWADAAAVIVTALLATFTVAIAVNLLRGRSMECGCFDVIGTVLGSVVAWFKPHAATWWTVLRDIVFLIPAVHLVREARR
jgi:hypothetical protein